MPVVRSIRVYRRRGRLQYIRLYRAWQNMHRRVKGTTKAGNGSNPWLGLTIAWTTFEEFRAWALVNGFSKTRNSLDRINQARGYGPNNCRWVTRRENTINQRIYAKAGDKVNYPDVPF